MNTELDQECDALDFAMAVRDAVAERDRLRAQRDELLAACKAMIGIDNPRADKPDHIDYAKAVQMGRAAIAKVEA